MLLTGKQILQKKPSDLDPDFIKEGGQSPDEPGPSSSRSRPGSFAEPNKQKRLYELLLFLA